MHALQTKLKQTLSSYIEKDATGADIVALTGLICDRDPSPWLAVASSMTMTIGTAARFELLDEHQVLDRETDLIWTRRNASSKKLAWKEAAQACAELRVGGVSTWRLPTIRELLGLVDYERSKPAIDPIFECSTDDWYWTSTPYASAPSSAAWVVNFYYGLSYDGHQGSDDFVRAVRPRQSL